MNDVGRASLPTWRQQARFTRKELRETLRDRRTIVTLVLMPVLLYPLLGLGFRFVAIQQIAAEEPEYRLVTRTEQEGLWLQQALNAGDRLLPASASPDDRPPTPRLQLFTLEEPTRLALEQVVASGEATLGVDVVFADPVGDGPEVQVDLLRGRESVAGRDAADYVAERLRAYNLAEVDRRVRLQGGELRLPVVERLLLVDSPESPSAILGLLPLVLLLMTVTGGVYPAIDLTAGERERGTLESLMALPVPRFQLLAAKFVAVVAVTMLTGMMNLLAMSVTVHVLQLEALVFGEAGLTWGLGVKLMTVLTTFAVFYSAVLLAITGSARSFKEAQAYLIPLLLLSLAPGMVILLPGWTLNYGTAVVPLVNMLLLARSLFEGDASLGAGLAATVSTLFYTLVALSLAARVFGNDAVASGSSGSWGELVRRPPHGSAAPSVNVVLLTLAMLFPAYFTASGLLARGTESPIGQRLVLSSVLTVTLFALLPGLLAWWHRVRFDSGFRVRGAHWLVWPAAVVLGLTAWPLVFQLVVWLKALGWGSFDAETAKRVEELLVAWKSVSPLVVVVAMGIVPGVCEELFFRGFLFAGLRTQLGGWNSVYVSAVAFGLFHVVLAGGAAPERFVPSLLMGFLLGWVAWRSGSVLPSILVHVTHNSLLVTVATYRDQLAGWGLGGEETESLPPTWLAASVAGLLVGVLLLSLSNRMHDSGTEAPPSTS